MNMSGHWGDRRLSKVVCLRIYYTATPHNHQVLTSQSLQNLQHRVHQLHVLSYTDSERLGEKAPFPHIPAHWVVLTLSLCCVLNVRHLVQFPHRGIALLLPSCRGGGRFKGVRKLVWTPCWTRISEMEPVFCVSPLYKSTFQVMRCPRLLWGPVTGSPWKSRDMVMTRRLWRLSAMLLRGTAFLFRRIASHDTKLSTWPGSWGAGENDGQL